MGGRSIVRIAILFGVLAVIGGSRAQAQGVDCHYFKVIAERTSTFDQPRADAGFIDALNRNDIVCVAGDQMVGDRVWALIAYKLLTQNQHKSIEGWAIKNSLQPATKAEIAALPSSLEAAPPPPARSAMPTAPPPSFAPPPVAAAPPPVMAPPPIAAAPPIQAAPPVAAPPGEVIVRFSQPIPSGGFPVEGHSLEELIRAVPTFPPIEGLPDEVWQKSCDSCHNWNRQTLCQQAMTYAQDAKMAMRKPHPFGGPEKLAMRNWAQHGCQ
jgi:hypothetical protein